MAILLPVAAVESFDQAAKFWLATTVLQTGACVDDLVGPSRAKAFRIVRLTHSLAGYVDNASGRVHDPSKLST